MNWLYEGKEFKEAPEDYISFIYKITNLDNGKYYIGKKIFFNITNPEISKKKYKELLEQDKDLVRKTKDKKKSKKGKVVWRYKMRDFKKETNWKTYTGSNDDLNKDIKNGAKIKKEILKFCTTKKQATYYEMKFQIEYNVLEDETSYNSNILGKFFEKDL